MRGLYVVATLAIIAFLLRACVSYEPVSDQTGGTGLVVSAGGPVAYATVSVEDTGGVLSGITDQGGRFDIPVDSTRQLFLSMANPLRHRVSVRVEKDGRLLKEWEFEKQVLGPNYFDFGTVHVVE